MRFVTLVSSLGIDDGKPYINFELFDKSAERGMHFLRCRKTNRYELLNITKAILFGKNRQKLRTKLIDLYTDNFIQIVNQVLQEMKNYHSLEDDVKDAYSNLLGTDNLIMNSNRLALIEYLELVDSNKEKQIELFKDVSDVIIEYLDRILK